MQRDRVIYTSYKCCPVLQGQEGIGSIPGPRGLKVIYVLIHYYSVLLKLHLSGEDVVLNIALLLLLLLFVLLLTISVT